MEWLPCCVTARHTRRFQSSNTHPAVTTGTQKRSQADFHITLKSIRSTVRKQWV